MDTAQRIVQIARKEFLELGRKAGVVAFILMVPVMEIIVLGYATAGAVEELPVAVHDADRSAASRRLIQTIDQSRAFAVTEVASDPARLERLLDEGQVSAFFVIPQGLERALAGNGETVALVATIDGSNTAVASRAAVYAEGIVRHFTARVLGGETLPIAVEPRICYNQELRREIFYIPGLLGSMLSLVVLSITAVCIVRERERGTLEQLMVTPIRPLELIAGKLVPVVVIAYVELGAMLLLTIYLFDVPVRGSLGLYVLLMFVYLLAEMGLGILISTISNSQAQALPTIMLLVTTSAILAGFFNPVETMPAATQVLSALLPLRYFVAITRDLFAKGAGLCALLPHLYPLLAMSVVFFSGSTWLLRRRLV